MKLIKITAIAASMCFSASAFALEGFSPHVDAEGKILLPEDFRVNMIHLGSWFVPEGDSSGFHDVYTEPESAIYYRENGVFPDGATLVKELRPHERGDYTTGLNVAFETGDIKQTFVMVKDSTNRFQETSAIWGHGWGWALFKPNETGNLSSNYQTDCFGCHIPAEKTDWIYTEAYPTLSKP